jgi:hypothetical protein
MSGRFCEAVGDLMSPVGPKSSTSPTFRTNFGADIPVVDPEHEPSGQAPIQQREHSGKILANLGFLAFPPRQV